MDFLYYETYHLQIFRRVVACLYKDLGGIIMRSNAIKKLVFMALFTGLTTLGTMAITVPMPFTGGYVHLGDPIVILSGILLGPVYGAIAAGLGSALADILLSWAFYAPATFIVKAALAFFVGLAYHKINGDTREMDVKVRSVYHAVVAYIIIVGGYFITDFTLFYLLPAQMGGDSAIAVASFMIGPNSLQIGFGIVVSLLLRPLLVKPFKQIYHL